MLAALVVKDSLVVEGCRKVVVGYTMVGVGYMMVGQAECKTLEVAGCNLNKQHKQSMNALNIENIRIL